MRVYNYPFIIKFSVIILIISKKVIVKVLSFLKRGVLLMCLSLTIILSIKLREIALLLSL
jgi:hypothetical protein